MATEGHRKTQRVWSDIRPSQPVKPTPKRRLIREFRPLVSTVKKNIQTAKSIRQSPVDTTKKEELKKKQIAQSLGRAHVAKQPRQDALPIVDTTTSFKKRSGIILAFATFIFLLPVGMMLSTNHQQKKGTVATSSLPTAPTLTKGTPTYATILPSGKTADSLGGWTRVSPPDRNPVFAYVDTVNKTPISVSEQPLPSDFTNSTDRKVAELATNYNATQKIPVGSTTVYVGTSTNGPQSLIFYKNDLLILIKSAERIENTIWSNYINSLQ